MQHGDERARIRCCWAFPGSLAALLASMGCAGEAGIGVPPPAANRGSAPMAAAPAPAPEVDAPPAAFRPAPPEVLPPEVPAPPAPAFVELDACSGELPACESRSAVACTLHCGERADGCTVYSEYVPLGTVDPSSYMFRFGAIDPSGQWVFYSSDWTGGRSESTPYRWSAANGVELLSDALGVPLPSDTDETLSVREVAANGDAILIYRFDANDSLQAYRWTIDDGPVPLDFVPTDMSADGRVVVGMRGDQAVIWDRVGGTRRLDGEALDAPLAPRLAPPDGAVPNRPLAVVALSDSGEFAWLAGPSGAGARWSQAQGLAPFESLAGLPAGAELTLADANGRALLASTGDAILAIYRLWQWSEAAGARELGTLPGLPLESSYLARFSRERAQVVVGDALLPNGGGSVTFRWSNELGMQRVTPAGKSSFPEYANADGTTLVGHEDNDDGTISDSFRWTARAGWSDVPGIVRGGVALGGDVLVARRWNGDQRQVRVLKYDAALEAGGALPIDIIDAGLVPEGYALDDVSAISEDARLLAGSARDAEGLLHGWVLRLRDSCSP
jgi:hypothetical protein